MFPGGASGSELLKTNPYTPVPLMTARRSLMRVALGGYQFRSIGAGFVVAVSALGRERRR